MASVWQRLINRWPKVLQTKRAWSNWCIEMTAAAKQFVEERGVGELAKISKLHFRTALRTQGLPEPPKTEWRKTK
jgi:hypothetical protein